MGKQEKAEQVEAIETETVETAEAEQAETAEAEQVEAKPEGVVRMVRSASEYPEPHEADVAASEVEHYKGYGWTEA